MARTKAANRIAFTFLRISRCSFSPSAWHECKANSEGYETSRLHFLEPLLKGDRSFMEIHRVLGRPATARMPSFWDSACQLRRIRLIWRVGEFFCLNLKSKVVARRSPTFW